MLEILKAERAATVTSALYLKEAERHAIKQARYLRGHPDGIRQSFKHKKDEQPPEPITISDVQRKVLDKGLANEITEHEEKFFGLQYHRKNYVRKYARELHLIYMFLRGKPMSLAENKHYSQPDWVHLEQLIELFAEEDMRTIKQQFAQWKDEALDYYHYPKHLPTEIAA